LLALAAQSACGVSDAPSQNPMLAASGTSATAGSATAGAASSGGNQAQLGKSGADSGSSNGAGASSTGGGIASAGRSSMAGSGNSSGGAGAMGDAGSAGQGEVAGASGDRGTSNYDRAILTDRPVGFWAMNRAPMEETDLTGNGHEGTYGGKGSPSSAELPNGDRGADFDGVEQYLSVPSSAAFSIPTTGTLTWEAWLRPDVLQFPHDDGVSGYVDWLGKCENYSPTCEWEARMYSTNTNESPNRPNRLSAYVFNPSAGLGSAADWQPSAGLITAGAWYHVVGLYTTLSQPSDCQNTADAPGSIDIWVNAVKWRHASHGQTGCMSQYNVVPKANGSAVNIATMAKESFFRGAIAKVAIYDHALDQAQITNHYTLMTGQQPTGSCAATCSF